MQNIDYSRRLRGNLGYSPADPYESSPSQGYIHHSQRTKPKSAFVLLIGAILLFTAGMVVGIQMSQKERSFASQSERSFSNVGRPMATETATEVEKPTEPSPETASSLVPGLKFPPKNDQINYMVQIGNFSPEEAGKLGKQLMQADPSLQGRIFRTSTGKLYAGYFYRMEDAREALDRISRQIPNSGDAMVKTIRF